MKILGLKITDIEWYNNRHGNMIEVYRINSKGSGNYHEYKATPRRIQLVRKIAAKTKTTIRFIDNDTGSISECSAPGSSDPNRVRIQKDRQSESISIMFRNNYAANDLLTELMETQPHAHLR